MHSFVIFIKLIKKIVLVVELNVSKEELHIFFQKNIDLVFVNLSNIGCFVPMI